MHELGMKNRRIMIWRRKKVQGLSAPEWTKRKESKNGNLETKEMEVIWIFGYGDLEKKNE